MINLLSNTWMKRTQLKWHLKYILLKEIKIQRGFPLTDAKQNKTMGARKSLFFHFIQTKTVWRQTGQVKDPEQPCTRLRVIMVWSPWCVMFLWASQMVCIVGYILAPACFLSSHGTVNVGHSLRKSQKYLHWLRLTTRGQTHTRPIQMTGFNMPFSLHPY